MKEEHQLINVIHYLNSLNPLTEYLKEFSLQYMAFLCIRRIYKDWQILLKNRRNGQNLFLTSVPMNCAFD